MSITESAIAFFAPREGSAYLAAGDSDVLNAIRGRLSLKAGAVSLRLTEEPAEDVTITVDTMDEAAQVRIDEAFSEVGHVGFCNYVSGVAGERGQVFLSIFIPEKQMASAMSFAGMGKLPTNIRVQIAGLTYGYGDDQPCWGNVSRRMLPVKAVEFEWRI